MSLFAARFGEMPTLRNGLRSLSAAILFFCFLTGPAASGEVRLGLGFDPFYLPFYVAQELGYFQKAGLRVQAVYFAAGGQALDAAVQGKVELTGATEWNILPARAKGYRLPILAVVARAPKLIKIVARRQLLSIYQLPGKRVGVQRTPATRYFYSRVMDAVGPAKGRRRPLSIPGPRLTAALKMGRLDAFISLAPWPSRALESLKDKVHVLSLPRAKEIYLPSLYLVSTGPVLEQDPKAVTLFLAGLIRARQFIRKKPDSAARILARIISLKPADVQEMLTSFSYPVRLDGRAERQVRDIADWLKEKKGLKIDGSAANFFAPEFLAWVDPGSVTMGR